MKHHFITASESSNGKKAYRKPSLKSFGQVSKLTRSNKGSVINDAEDGFTA